ncbi:MAG: roadblock/LC7 domain-containing protein [Frankiaceae bacterium]
MSDLRPLPGDSTSRSGRLDRVVADLITQAPEIEAAAVVTFDGLPMVSALPPGMDEDRVAAMSAALLSLGERAAEGLGRGELSQVYIEGESGTVFLISCDNEAVLVAVAAAGAKAGLMLYEVRRAAASIAGVLREDDALAASAAPVAQEAPAAPVVPFPAPTQPAEAPVAEPVQPLYAEQLAASAASATSATSATSAPLGYPHQAPLEASPQAVNGSAGGTGWSSYAPGSSTPGEPTPWS